jgi:hypothetical protein
MPNALLEAMVQQTAEDQFGDPLVSTHAQPYAPAIDAQGNADCQGGQGGYPEGPLSTGNRYGPNEKVCIVTVGC